MTQRQHGSFRCGARLFVKRVRGQNVRVLYDRLQEGIFDVDRIVHLNIVPRVEQKIEYEKLDIPEKKTIKKRCLRDIKKSQIEYVIKAVREFDKKY